MGKTEYVVVQRHLGSPFIVTFDQKGKGLSRASVLIPRKAFDQKKITKRLRVTVEWNEEIEKERKRKRE